jgi:hypothetical protein
MRAISARRLFLDAVFLPSPESTLKLGFPVPQTRELLGDVAPNPNAA